MRKARRKVNPKMFSLFYNCSLKEDWGLRLRVLGMYRMYTYRIAIVHLRASIVFHSLYQLFTSWLYVLSKTSRLPPTRDFPCFRGCINSALLSSLVSANVICTHPVIILMFETKGNQTKGSFLPWYFGREVTDLVNRSDASLENNEFGALCRDAVAQ